ncbi:MAG: hypothetical protein IJM19_03825 [Ruminococcus sp.]|nr:hypothetical protein [Ruminococcus sp.]
MKSIKILSAVTVLSMLVSCGSAEAEIIYQAPEEESSKISASEEFDSVNLMNNQVDVDLTVLNSTMIYGQVYEMIYNTDEYTGKGVKVKGPFSYYKDPNTGNEYFSVTVSDISACCSQAVEFVLKGEKKYPDDYPELNTEITVVGNFNCYKEGVYTYCQLTDAEIL